MRAGLIVEELVYRLGLDTTELKREAQEADKTVHGLVKRVRDAFK